MRRRAIPIARHNSTADGSRATADTWAQLDFARAWIDPGLGAGPYLKVPRVWRDAMGRWVDETVHRVRPVDRLGARCPVRHGGDGGEWHWAPAESVETAVAAARALREAMR